MGWRLRLSVEVLWKPSDRSAQKWSVYLNDLGRLKKPRIHILMESFQPSYV